MRCTKPLLDWHVSAVLVALGCVMTAASCASTDEDAPMETSADAGLDSPEVSPNVDDDAASDGAIAHDAALADASSRAVECTSPPCARALVTTMPGYAVSEGYCALLDDGTVACWGANEAGQLGRGEDASTADSAVAARVAGLTNVVKLEHTCALDASGSVWCWGTGPFLRSETRATSTERTPVKLPIGPAKNVGVGDWVGCAEVDDEVLCWGYNDHGQIGPTHMWETVGPTPVPLPAGAPIARLVISDAAFAIRDDGALLSWGSNPPLARVSSLSPDPHPGLVALGAVSSIDATKASACATVAGTGYCWGAIDPGAVPGAGPPALLHALPEPIVTPEPVVQIATTRLWQTYSREGGLVVQPQRWCAIGVSGEVHCWGFNTHGQAGDRTQNYAFESVHVVGLPAPVAQVRTMPLSTCALLTTGKVFCWGNNYYGQLGIGTIKGVSLEPKEVVLP